MVVPEQAALLPLALETRGVAQGPLLVTTVRLKVEQIQLVSAAWHLDLGCIGLQGA
jgi:hypothetical protein